MPTLAGKKAFFAFTLNQLPKPTRCNLAVKLAYILTEGWANLAQPIFPEGD